MLMIDETHCEASVCSSSIYMHLNWYTMQNVSDMIYVVCRIWEPSQPSTQSVYFKLTPVKSILVDFSSLSISANYAIGSVDFRPQKNTWFNNTAKEVTQRLVFANMSVFVTNAIYGVGYGSGVVWQGLMQKESDIEKRIVDSQVCVTHTQFLLNKQYGNKKTHSGYLWTEG